MTGKIKIIGFSFIGVLFIGGLLIRPNPPKKIAQLTTTSATSPVPTTTNPTTPVTSNPNVSATSPVTTPTIAPLNAPMPTYTYTPSSASKGSTTIASPDPTKCPSIRDEITQANADLVAQDQALETDIKNYQAYLVNMAQTAVARGSGYTAAEQQSISNVQTQLGIDQNKVNANLGQINSLDTPYNQQLAANECG